MRLSAFHENNVRCFPFPSLSLDLPISLLFGLKHLAPSGARLGLGEGGLALSLPL